MYTYNLDIQNFEKKLYFIILLFVPAIINYNL